MARGWRVGGAVMLFAGLGLMGLFHAPQGVCGSPFVFSQETANACAVTGFVTGLAQALALIGAVVFICGAVVAARARV